MPLITCLKAHLIEDQDLQDKLRNKYVKALNELGVDGRECEKPIRFLKANGKKFKFFCNTNTSFEF